MAELKNLAVQARKETGKGPMGRLRKEGQVPGVFYDGKGKNVLVQVEGIKLQKLYSKVGISQIFELEISDEGKSDTRPALIRDIVYHPIKPFVIHVDFYGVDMTQKLNVQVPVEIQGEAKGIEEGGILSVLRDTIEISCMPGAIPESIVIDVSGLGVNDYIHIEEIAMPEGVEAVFEENYSVVGVSVMAAEEEEVEEVEGEEAEEAVEEEAEPSEEEESSE